MKSWHSDGIPCTSGRESVASWAQNLCIRTHLGPEKSRDARDARDAIMFQSVLCSSLAPGASEDLLFCIKKRNQYFKIELSKETSNA